MYILLEDFVKIFMSLFICTETAKIIQNRLCLLNNYCYIESSAVVISFRRGFTLICGITDIFNLVIYEYMLKVGFFY